MSNSVGHVNGYQACVNNMVQLVWMFGSHLGWATARSGHARPHNRQKMFYKADKKAGVLL